MAGRGKGQTFIGAALDVETATIGAASVSALSLTASATANAALKKAGTQYTVYASSSGNDANDGKSQGSAVLTLAQALSILNLSGNKIGEIVWLDAASGTVNVNAPLHFIEAVTLRGLFPGALTINRNFSTPNSRSVWDAVVTAAGTNVTSATATFVAGDTGKVAMIYGAGTGGGYYYGFLTFTNSTTCALSAATTIARDATTDPKGVKLTIAGDWNRVVTDAGISTATSVVSSATAAWTNADVGTELVIDGAGQGGQALRSVIKSVSGNNAIIKAIASATVTNKTCAIGINFGHLLGYHAGGGLTGGPTLTDNSTGNGTIGAAIAFISDDQGTNTTSPIVDNWFDSFRITNTDTAGAWEHDIDIDGTWAQSSSGPGARRSTWVGVKCFGSRRASETIRIAGAVHHEFIGSLLAFESPTAIRQGVVLLNPRLSVAAGATVTEDIHISGSECGGDYYSEATKSSISGGSWGGVSSTGKTIWLAPCSSGVVVNTHDRQATDTTYDQGTGNSITTQLLQPRSSERKLVTPTVLLYDSFDRSTATIADIVPPGWASGVAVYSRIWLPGGLKVSKVVIAGGSTALAWGSGWTAPHFRIGLMDPDGNLLGESADTGGTQVFSSATIGAPISLASSVIVPRSGFCYVGLLINSGTGGSAFVMPNLAGVTVANVGNVGSVLLTIVAGAGLTDLPSSIVLNTGGVTRSLYCGVA